MPQRKQPAPNTSFSAWEYLGNDVLDAIKRWDGGEVSGNEVAAIMAVAICPAALAESVKHQETGELAKVFSAFYEKHPDLALRLLGVIRGRWNDRSVTAVVQRHMLTRVYHSPGKFHSEVTDKDRINVIGRRTSVESVKMARKRMKTPPQRLWISPELTDALRALRSRGFDVGLGL